MCWRTPLTYIHLASTRAWPEGLLGNAACRRRRGHVDGDATRRLSLALNFLLRKTPALTGLHLVRIWLRCFSGLQLLASCCAPSCSDYCHIHPRLAPCQSGQFASIACSLTRRVPQPVCACASLLNSKGRGWSNRAESRGRASRLGKMSVLAIWRICDSVFPWDQRGSI